MPDAQKTLNLINNSLKGVDPLSVLVVFDLDSTLYNVSHRTEHILRRFAQEKWKLWPTEAKLLENVIVSKRDWGISEALNRLDIKVFDLDFAKALKDYWIEHFFSNEFLHLDQPYEGAVDYVTHIHSMGVNIKYLTARNRETMEKGTISSLKQWNLPLEDSRVELVMKPNKTIKDSHFKKNVFSEIHGTYGKLWYFENEPVIIHLINNHFPHINIIFIDSVHSKKATAPTHLPTVSMNFK